MSWRDIVFILVVLVLFFLFSGEPDLWDRLHAMAMGQCK